MILSVLKTFNVWICFWTSLFFYFYSNLYSSSLPEQRNEHVTQISCYQNRLFGFVDVETQIVASTLMSKVYEYVVLVSS